MTDGPANSPFPAVPDWAKTVIDHLADALIDGRDHLTDNENRLITAASLLLRSRSGDTSGHIEIEAAPVFVASMLRNALRDLDEQEAIREATS